MKLFGRRDPDDPPCIHMVGILNRTADGTGSRFARWYVRLHIHDCTPCRRFLAMIEHHFQLLRDSREAEPSPQVMERLADALHDLPVQEPAT